MISNTKTISKIESLNKEQLSVLRTVLKYSRNNTSPLLNLIKDTYLESIFSEYRSAFSPIELNSYNVSKRLSELEEVGLITIVEDENKIIAHHSTNLIHNSLLDVQVALNNFDKDKDRETIFAVANKEFKFGQQTDFGIVIGKVISEDNTLIVKFIIDHEVIEAIRFKHDGNFLVHDNKN